MTTQSKIIPETMLNTIYYLSGSKEFDFYNDEEIMPFFEKLDSFILTCCYLQKDLSNACKIVLDSKYTEGDMNLLSIDKRYYIFSRTIETTFKEELEFYCPKISISTEILRLGQPFKQDRYSIYSDEHEYGDLFDQVESIEYLSAKYKDAEVEKVNCYHVDNGFGILYAEFWEMVIGNYNIKRCIYCNKYFIPFSKTAEYCDRMIDEKEKR